MVFKAHNGNNGIRSKFALYTERMHCETSAEWQMGGKVVNGDETTSLSLFLVAAWREVSGIQALSHDLIVDQFYPNTLSQQR